MDHCSARDERVEVADRRALRPTTLSPTSSESDELPLLQDFLYSRSQFFVGREGPDIVQEVPCSLLPCESEDNLGERFVFPLGLGEGVCRPPRILSASYGPCHSTRPYVYKSCPFVPLIGWNVLLPVTANVSEQASRLTVHQSS
jgi:hypothetical protein